MGYLNNIGLSHLWTKIKTYIDGKIISVNKGGTGKTSHTANAVLTGNGTNAVKNVATAKGAFYATSANGAASFGILPVAEGGTGATTAETAQTNLGVAISAETVQMFKNAGYPIE